MDPFRIIDAGIRRWLWAHSGMSTLLLRWAHSGSSTLLLGGGYGPIQLYRHCCFGGSFRIIDAGIRRGYEPIRVYRHCCLGGPIQNCRRHIRRWLWAHSVISTLLLRWGHSELSTPVFGGGYGPIQVCRHCCFGGPIQDYRRRYSALAMGPFRYINIAASVGPFMNVDTCPLVGPFSIIDAVNRRDYGPIQVCRHCCFGGPIHDYRRRYSAVAMGPCMNVDTSALMGPFRIIDAGIRWWLWAHSGISTLLPRWAHSGLSTPVFGDGYGPIQIYRHCCFGGPTQDYRSQYSVWLWAHSGMSTLLLRWARSGLSTLLFGGGYGPIQVYRRCCLGGPIHDYRRRYSAVAMGPFMNVDTSALVGPFRIIDAGIRRDYGPIQVCRHCCFGGPIHDYRCRYSAVAMGPFMNVDTSALAGPLRIIEAGIRRGYGPIQVCRHCCFGGPVQDNRHCYSVATVGPFMYVDASALVGPFRIIDAGIRRWLWAHSGIST